MPTSHHWTRMYADAQFELILRSMLDGEVTYHIQQMQSHHGDLDRMVPFRDLLYDRTNSADYHVGVSDRFDLVYIIVANNLVKASVKIVQQSDHLKGRALEAQLGKADDVAEIYGHILVRFRFNLLSAL